MPSPLRGPFPDPEETAPEGVVCFTDRVETALLLPAYRQGIFPWPVAADAPVPWVSPPERAIIEFCDLHVGRRLARTLRTAERRCTIDAAFDQVIDACATASRPGQNGTWIFAEMKRAYSALHRAGHAHSVEIWNGDHLIGGIYGVDCGGAFSAESMFHRETDASKRALLRLIEHLRSRGLSWIDVQTLSPHVERLGAKEIPRTRFLHLLKETLEAKRNLFP